MSADHDHTRRTPSDGPEGNGQDRQDDLKTEAPQAADPASQIEDLRRQLADSQDRYLRERAETENFKKRLLREKAEDLRFATEPLLRDLLPIVDNLERALEHASGDASVREGIDLVLKALLGVLERHNVKRVEAHGQPFDPAFHQAIAQVESLEHAPATVVEQHQVGYTLNNRLIRPAVVTVNASKRRDATVESDKNSD
jgi:molecular chaperone GrpE